MNNSNTLHTCCGSVHVQLPRQLGCSSSIPMRLCLQPPRNKKFKLFHKDQIRRRQKQFEVLPLGEIGEVSTTALKYTKLAAGQTKKLRVALRANRCETHGPI